MRKEYPMLPLFSQFIKDSTSGKRLKKNGEKINLKTIDNYGYVFKNLTQFSINTSFDLRVVDCNKINKRELLTEKKYWKKFYKNYTEFLYKKGCFDNYVGANIKCIRIFFTYIKQEKDIMAGDFHKEFYVRKQELPVLVLSPEQLKFLIHDKVFESQLTITQRKIKDIFVFGCTTGLRYSDVFLITNKNIEQSGEDWYLNVTSKKTKTNTSVKLPAYAIEIISKYQSKSARKTLFTKTDLSNFNRILKIIGEKAGWTKEVEISREQQGVAQKVNYAKEKTRFCDNMSSHMMRRTAITTLLILGMPEHLVRKISGHSHGSTSFNRYVHHAQAYIDKEIDKVHSKLENYMM